MPTRPIHQALVLIFILAHAGSAATISLFSDKFVAQQVRGWNGPKDLSASVSLTVENDAVQIRVIANDDLISQGREDAGIDQGDHVQFWLAFEKGPPLRLDLSAGQLKGARSSTLLRAAGKDPEILSSTPPDVIWNESGYELNVSIPLADLRLDPDTKLKSWAASIADRDLAAPLRVEMLRDQEGRARILLGRCHDAGLSVHYWQSADPAKMGPRTAQLIRFQNGGKPRQRFDGMGFDVGAILADPSSYKAATATEIIGRLEKSAQVWRRQFPRAPVTVAFPGWLAQSKFSAVADRFAEIADVLLVQASGSDESSLSQAEGQALAAGRRQPKPFWLGARVPGTLGNRADFEKPLQKISSALGQVTEFRGIVVDDYRRYRVLMNEAAQPGTQPGGKSRALIVRCGNTGHAENIVTNDYFERDFLSFANLPFGDKSSQFTQIFFEAGSFVRGEEGAEVVLRFPRGARFDNPRTWAPYR